MVLYFRDIETILGKTEKAVESLIARDGLPFRLKTLGGRRCVDIFQAVETGERSLLKALQDRGFVKTRKA